MRYQAHNNRIFNCILIVGFLAASCSTNNKTFERNTDFNLEWKYRIAEIENGSDPYLDISTWINVDLPHDWSIEDYNLQDSTHVGPFFRDQPRGADIGYLRTGTCWYRKIWKTPKKLDQGQVILNFDGVQTQMELWVNGKMAGDNVYGYSPLNFNITEFLNAPGKENHIAVKTVNTGENSRWFSGAGIYRPVKLSIVDQLSVSDWGAFITTPEVSESRASVSIEVSINNFSDASSLISCSAQITGPDMLTIDLEQGSLQLEANRSGKMILSGEILKPMLWTIEDPALYQATITVYSDNEATDTYAQKFGIRSIDYSPENGFMLNGKEVLMKGSCMHHDNGLLGAAAFKDAEYRRVKIMKENGYNAIRTSHNPPSSDFLDACDEIGMLVIDESFDHWVMAKRPNDYSNYFKEWHKKDIQAMVRRDRNHPSVVMWSFGNEVQERANPDGIEIGKKLIAAIKELDTTRPTTQAVCGFWDNPGKDWDYSAGAFEISEVQGYNYQFENYESDHRKYPERIIFGSESVPKHAWENWELVKKHSYVIGDFVWTGMDYIGESGIGHTIYSTDPKADASGLQPWPWYNAWCGDIDLIGNKKAQSLYRDIIWGESKLEINVQKPSPEGSYEIVSYWGWPEEEPGWNWEGHEKKPLLVRVYSTYPKVRLELNGKIIGEKTIIEQDKFTAEFKVQYEPGTLKALALDGESIVESKILRTSGAVKNITLIPEINEFKADRSRLVFIRVEAWDDQDILNIRADSKLEVSVSGQAELIAAGNAAPTHQGGFQDKQFNLFMGKGLIILRSTGTPGEINLSVQNDNLGSSDIKLMAL